MSLISYDSALQQTIDAAEHSAWVQKLWNKDTSLWTTDPSTSHKISQRLGWLDIESWLDKHASLIEIFSQRARSEFDAFVVLGMGGSSLSTDVFRQVFQKDNLHILDSTDPETLLHLEQQIDLKRTMFIVASKSGNTIEVEAFRRYFHGRIPNKKQFVAITDPGTPLASMMGKDQGYSDIFINPPDIGGRFSALSFFGLIPASLSGVSMDTLRHHLSPMIQACKQERIRDNPGALLGISMAVASKIGKNKLTLWTTKQHHSFGSWMEQLIAESTGKQGMGVLPIVDEVPHPETHYNDDRFFVTHHPHIVLPTSIYESHPSLALSFSQPYELGAEFFRWKVATAFAGMVLGVNPFDEPNVTQSKEITRSILDTGQTTLETITKSVLDISSTMADIDIHFQNIRPGDYGSILAYVPFTREHQDLIKAFANQLSKKHRIPFSIGFGPRFLHSTGQFHKGGINQGRFIQITSTGSTELEIPGWTFGFSALKLAQALGDFNAMKALDRRIINLHFDDHKKLVKLVGRT